MKYVKPQKNLIAIFYPPALILGAIIYWHFSELIASHLTYHALIIFPALLLALTKLGKKRLSNNDSSKDKTNTARLFLGKIFLLQLAMFGAYLGLCIIAGDNFPVMTKVRPHLFINSINQFIGFGLLPWILYALITVSMGLLAYREQTDAHYSNLLKPITKQHHLKPFGLIVNTTTKHLNTLSFSTSLMFISLLLISFPLSGEIHLVYGFKSAALLTTLVLIFLSSSNINKRITKRFFSSKVPTIWGVLTFCILFGFTLLLINTAMSGIAPHGNIKPMIPRLINTLILKNWHASWVIFSSIWWLIFTPAVCSYLTKISKGYRIRDVIFALSILPIIGTTVIFITHHFNMAWPTVNPDVLECLALISFVSMLHILFQKKNMSNIVMGYFPKNGIIKHRDQYPFYLRTVKIMTASLYFFFVLGINGLTIFLFSLFYLYFIGFFVTAFTAITISRRQ